MLKKVGAVIKKNFVIIICIVIFILFCIFIKNNFMDEVKMVDNNIQIFFATKMVDNANTEFMKSITFLGDKYAIVSIFLLCILLFRNKIISAVLTADLGFIGLLTLLLKNSFRRIRPVFSLIETPTSFSFPSGHTYFAVGFYGLIIYFLWKSNINKLYKYILTFVMCMLIIFIGISRLYLGVHYFSDVIGGLILGILTIVLFISIYLDYDWKWKK